MNLSLELQAVSEVMRAAAAAGRWDAVSLAVGTRADVLDGLREGGAAPEALVAALRSGEEVLAAVRRLREKLETELEDLRATQRSARAWRPYREASGGALDVSS